MAESRALVVALFAGAVVLRAVVLAGDPRLSDDVHRYVFEGGLVAAGISPYAHAPSAPERADERERWAAVHARMNHVDVPAAYPPVAQYAFALGVCAAGGPAAEEGRAAERALRALFTLCDLAVLALLFGAARERGRPSALVCVWGWCPLVALEFAGSAHLDSLAILLTLAALLGAERAQRGRGAAEAGALGLAVLTKWLPLPLAPFVLRALPAPRRALGWFAAALLLAALPILLLEDGARGLFDGLHAYAARWESFNLVFSGLRAGLEAVLAPEVAGGVARGLSGLAFLAVGVGLWRRRAGPLVAATALLGAFLVLTPTLHPWYLTWIVPFLVFFRSWAFGGLVALAPLLYWPLTEWQAKGTWVEPGWLWPIVGLPFLIGLTLELVARARQAKRENPR